MKTHTPAIYSLVLALTLVSCDKAKNMANQATSNLKDKIAEKTAETDAPKVDDTLQKLVDQTPEGVIFRKDLPFPPHLEVRTTLRQEMAIRFSQSSAIEKQTNATIKGNRVLVTKLERTGDQVRYTLEQTEFTVPSVVEPKDANGAKDTKGAKGAKDAKGVKDAKGAKDAKGVKDAKGAKGAKGAKDAKGPKDAMGATSGQPENNKIADPLAQGAIVNKPVAFQKTGKTWKAAEHSEFHAVALAAELGPVLDELLIENALAPHSLWFSKHRLKIGDELDVTGNTLPMLLAGHATGSFHLKLESIEAVNGHPCGVFSVSGDYSRKEFPDFQGKLTDQDVSIQSGKLWLSLLHPVILKEELDTVQSFKSGGNGGLAGRGQGSVKVSVTREWKAINP